jgi:hypothetical protein
MIEIVFSASALLLSAYACFKTQKSGPQGPQGEQGFPGLQGSQGLQGEPGISESKDTRSHARSDVSSGARSGVKSNLKFRTKDERREAIRERENDPEIQMSIADIRERLRKGSGLISPDPNLYAEKIEEL